MLALRLARGSHPAVLCRRLLLACAAGGVGFLLLSALAYAVGHPGGGRPAVLRLAWCAVPLAATLHLAVVVARSEPAAGSRRGLAVVGVGPARLPALAAVSTASAALLGSLLALLAFLLLRGDLAGLPLHGAAAGVLPESEPLPAGAVLTLLSVAPAGAAAAGALALRPGRTHRRRPPAAPPGGADVAAVTRAEPDLPVPNGLPWGTALTGSGIALSGYAGMDTAIEPDGWLPLTGTLGGATPGVVGGWLLMVAGLVLAAPGVVHLCGLLLATGRPGVLRLLAGRVLQEEAHRVGRPMGALCAASAAVLVLADLDGLGQFGPLGNLGLGIVLVCALAAVATAADEARSARRPATALLLRLGASRGLLRGAALARIATLLAAFVPLTWLVAQLMALPTGSGLA
ncbi:hypothetical protein [Streptomyces hoynatensis]|uniref:Uncharacterized protein n=1 Tax=Streptomyces hoynatensis TaxID=1141874 RepID=A0A3A9YRW4_9ACTN|nr:hypothetical protein [Streptomyces hoynatensis]RKN38768.1 hypothetical protein D7294_23340 [Streptomyces hoynatensis]